MDTRNLAGRNNERAFACQMFEACLLYLRMERFLLSPGYQMTEGLPIFIFIFISREESGMNQAVLCLLPSDEAGSRYEDCESR